MSNFTKALMLCFAFIFFCAFIGVKIKDMHMNKVCSIRGKTTYIYGGYEYSCFNGVKV